MSQPLSRLFVEELINDAKQVWPKNFLEIEGMFNKCCFAMAFGSVNRLGLFQKKDDFETLESIREKVSLFKDAEYVFGQILRILCDEGVLKEKDNGWVCVDPEPYIETPAEALTIATRAFPEEGAPFQWLARSWDGLVDFLTGKLYAEEVMFPMGSFKLVEEVYNTSDVYGFYSRLAGRVVKRFVEDHYTEPVTMLEVGAGTGNGTANVLNESSNRFAKYYFTDVSKSLVQMGKRRFKKSGYDFLTYQAFDACADIGEQGFEENSIDIALAVNVLHATDDILVSLETIKKMLKKDGVLILSELSPPDKGIYRYMELTFGLLPSYSQYKDKELRPLAPVVRPNEWISAMENVGFSNVCAVPGTASEQMDRGGIVIGMK